MTAISVVVATCDGRAFVAEQLESIVSQTRPPDEIIVTDDASTDDTLEVVRDVLAQTGARVVVNTNADRLGVTANFAAGIGRATGDVIALADQDDRWLPNKLRRLERMLGEHPSAGGVFTDGLLIDGNGRRISGTVWRQAGVPSRADAAEPWYPALADLVRGNFVTGATLAFRAAERPLLLPIPETGLHDAWIALLLAARSRLLALPEPSIDYRLHGANVAGFEARNPALALAERRRKPAVRSRELAFFESARARLNGHMDAGAEALLDRKLEHLRARASLASSPWRRTGQVAREVARGGYARYGRGWRSVAYDVVFGAEG